MVGNGYSSTGRINGMICVFVNLTNHPSAMWSAEQLAAAERFGQIIDMSFPTVPPEATADEVHLLAERLVKDVLRIKEDGHTITVHVMGEHTLTCAVVAKLKAREVKCVASTSERDAVMLPDGKKISEFKFVQFREY